MYYYHYQYPTGAPPAPQPKNSRRAVFPRGPLLGLFISLGVAHPAAGAEELTAKDIAAARKLYVAKCAKCHRFYEPTNYSEIDWHAWMEKMEKKSKLDADQRAQLHRYLDAYRAGRLPGKPQDEPKRKPRSGAAP